jgi:hypothetical protein
MPAQPTPQLDLFEHSRDTMLRNDALDALLRRDAGAAAQARQALAQIEPQHAALSAIDTLIGALAAALAGNHPATPFSHHAKVALERAQLEQAVLPAALAQFGAAAASAWLRPFWRRLAERAAPLPYLAALPDDHAAPLWLRVGDAAAAQAAAQAVEGIESWRRIPAPLAWMARARHRSDGLDAIWPLLAELAWLAPARLGSTVRDLADPLLARLLRRYEEEVDPGDQAGIAPLAWFPAWLLIDQPALLPRLREAGTGLDSAPERVFKGLVELLGLERQGRHHELIASRKRLRDQQPALYAAYMQSR